MKVKWIMTGKCLAPWRATVIPHTGWQAPCSIWAGTLFQVDTTKSGHFKTKNVQISCLGLIMILSPWAVAPPHKLVPLTHGVPPSMTALPSKPGLSLYSRMCPHPFILTLYLAVKEPSTEIQKEGCWHRYQGRLHVLGKRKSQQQHRHSLQNIGPAPQKGSCLLRTCEPTE